MHVDYPGGAQKGVKIKLIPIFLNSSFSTVVTTLEYKNGSYSNWIYNVNMHIEHPGGGPKGVKIKLIPIFLIPSFRTVLTTSEYIQE